MNILPTSPERMATPEQLERYFDDMRRWNYDVAYSAFYAFPLAELRSVFRKLNSPIGARVPNQAPFVSRLR